MWLRGLGLALLVWSPGVLHAIRGEGPCSPPNLKDGYFLPVKESYLHGTPITYSCDTGYKFTVEGWWATSRCENGEWSDEPQCVAETACLPSAIPNAIFNHGSKHWHEDGSTIKISCNEGYLLNNPNNTVQCTNGTWSSVEVCQKHPHACGPPPNVPNAVIIHQKYKELYSTFSEVLYQCKDGFLTEDKESTKSVYCVAGNWTEGPSCTSSTRPGTKETQPPFIPIEHCGDHPIIPDGVAVQQGQHALKYECSMYYKLVGPETVVCQDGGTWSEVPTCKEDFCLLTTGDHPDLKLTGSRYFRNGDTQRLDCVDKWMFSNYSVVRCINGQLHVSRCCNKAQINTGLC